MLTTGPAPGVILGSASQVDLSTPSPTTTRKRSTGSDHIYLVQTPETHSRTTTTIATATTSAAGEGGGGAGGAGGAGRRAREAGRAGGGAGTHR